MEPLSSRACVVRTTSFLRTTDHDPSIANAHTPHPAARRPATVKARPSAPPTLDTIVSALLGFLHFVALIGVVEVLRLAARRGGEWHLLVHPATPTAWVGFDGPIYALFLAVDPHELASVSRADVWVNAPTTLDILIGSRIMTACVASTGSLAAIARLAADTERALTLASAAEAWSVTIAPGPLVEAIEALDAWGVDPDADVLVRPHVGLAGRELIFDGGGRRLWTLAVEPLEELPQGVGVDLMITLPPAEPELSPDAWPDADHPVPAGRAALAGEVG